MAIYHASTKPIARSAGRSSVAAAAYRAAVILTDARTGVVHDYTRKRGVEAAEIVIPGGGTVARNALWDAAELAEKRKDARTAREWIVALPSELSAEARKRLARDFAEALVQRFGVAADLAIHAPDQQGDQRNHHVHVLTTTRQVRLGEDGALLLGEKASIELSDSKRRAQGLGGAAEEVQAVRELWERLANAALEQSGVEARIDCRSLRDQSIDREATQHLGPTASAMERRGVESDRGDGNRVVAANNARRAALSAEIRDLQAERVRREVVEVEREGRRQKLLAFAEMLRSDQESRQPLKPHYQEAGYRLEDRDGKKVWIYPHADLKEERRTVFIAYQEWSSRKAVRVEQERQAEAERQALERREKILERARLRQDRRDLFDQIKIRERWGKRQQQRAQRRRAELERSEEYRRMQREEEEASAARNDWYSTTAGMAFEAVAPEKQRRRTPWQEWRNQTLAQRYGPELAARAEGDEDWYIRMRPDLGGLNIRDKSGREVIDADTIIKAEHKDGVQDIPLIIELAQAKGWKSLEFTGSDEFRLVAAVAALDAGLAVADPDLQELAEQELDVRLRLEEGIPNQQEQVQTQRAVPKRGHGIGD